MSLNPTLKSGIQALFDTFGSRAISIGLSAAATFAAQHYKFVVSPAAITSLGLGIYGLLHTVIDGPDSQPAASK